MDPEMPWLERSPNFPAEDSCMLIVHITRWKDVWVPCTVTPWPAACQASLSFTISQSLSNSCLSSQWSHPTISSSVIPCSCCLQSFPASGSFPVSWLFASGGQSIGASTSVLPVNIKDWFLLGFTALISLQINNQLQLKKKKTKFPSGPCLCSDEFSSQ